MNTAIMAAIDSCYNVTADIDPEVRQRWYATGLYLHYDPVYPYAEAWVGSMGRNKYIKPIYQSLQDSGQHDLGVQWNNANVNFYCHITETAVLNILFPPTETTEPALVPAKVPRAFRSRE